MKTRSKHKSNGFTLIELLVAMAITTVIITILVSITALSLDTWNRSRSEVRAARQGKAMVDSMARDFESLVVRKGNDFEWLYAVSNLSSDGPNGNSSPNAIDLIFFSASTDRYDGKIGTTDDKGGDVSTIGYQLVYQDPIDPGQAYGLPPAQLETLKTFVLYRKLVNPKETFENNLGQGTLEGKLDFEDSNLGMPVAVSAQENFICENVYQFTLTFHLRYTDSSTTPAKIKTVRVPVGQGVNSVTNLSIKGTGITDINGNIIAGIKGESNAPIDGNLIKSAQLSAVEISLTVLSNFGLQQLGKRTFGTATEKAEFIAKNSYEYTKLVQVPGS